MNTGPPPHAKRSLRMALPHKLSDRNRSSRRGIRCEWCIYNRNDPNQMICVRVCVCCHQICTDRKLENLECMLYTHMKPLRIVDMSRFMQETMVKVKYKTLITPDLFKVHIFVMLVVISPMQCNTPVKTLLLPV